MKEKESTQSTPGSLRREIWINPDGGRRLHRTTSAAKETTLDSEEEDLQSLPSIEVYTYRLNIKYIIINHNNKNSFIYRLTNVLLPATYMYMGN